MSRRTRAALGAVSAVLLGVALTGCSGDESPSKGSTTSGSASSPATAASPYLPVPDGVELTDQGSTLELGQNAVVAWKPSAGPAKGDVAVLQLRVTKVEQVEISALKDWHLDAKAKKSTPYFVHTTMTNAGSGNLAGTTVPLYLKDGADSLVPASSFQSLFKPCPSQPLPKPFQPGAKTQDCHVYLLAKGGDFDGVAFYSGPGFSPISWTGEPTKPEPKSDKNDKNKHKNKSKNGKNGT